MSEDEDRTETGATPESLEARLDEADEATEAAETEADLDGIEASLSEIEADLEAADLPEPEDEDEPSPREQLEERLAAVRERLEGERGPYAEDVLEEVRESIESIETGEWTETGEADLVEPVETFLSDVESTLSSDVIRPTDDEPASLVAALEGATDVVEDAALDPDDDAEPIAALLEAAEALAAGVDAAEEWDDLTVRQKLQARGFFDVLNHYKDYPPEWSALKEHEQRGNTEMILLGLDLLGSGFMEDHCLDALRRMADESALDAMMARAEKRDQAAIEVLGKIGSDEPLDMLLDYATNDKNPLLQLVTIGALGEIGSEEATQTVADRLVHEDERVRSGAARALGMIGDPRAIAPLADVLDDDDSEAVRGSAAWALNQIGTQRALDALAPFADDRSYLVQVEAEKAVVS